MEEKKKIWTNWKLWVGIIIAIVVLIVIIMMSTRNDLSKSDTFDRFITLVEDGKYEEAKKLTTNNFSADLSKIKDVKISKLKKDYELSNEDTLVYIEEYTLSHYIVRNEYYFQLRQTLNGWKIDNYYQKSADSIEDGYEKLYENSL